MEGNDSNSQPSPATTLTPYERLTNAIQTDPRCAQEVSFRVFSFWKKNLSFIKKQSFDLSIATRLEIVDYKSIKSLQIDRINDFAMT